MNYIYTFIKNKLKVLFNNNKTFNGIHINNKYQLLIDNNHKYNDIKKLLIDFLKYNKIDTNILEVIVEI